MKVQESKLRALIEESRSFVDFGDFGDGASEQWCASAEAALGISLPPSLRWWLKNYGGGEVLGEEIYSIYGQDFDTVVGGDLVRQYRALRSEGVVTSLQLPICHSDIDGLFFIDKSRVDESGESPVVSAATRSDYAVDFSDFLAKRIAMGR